MLTRAEHVHIVMELSRADERNMERWADEAEAILGQRQPTSQRELSDAFMLTQHDS
jgi:hypothetical protein